MSTGSDPCQCGHPRGIHAGGSDCGLCRCVSFVAEDAEAPITDALIEQDVRRRTELNEQLRGITAELAGIGGRLARAGVDEHRHGTGVDWDPDRGHAHPHDDPAHRHPPGEDAPWPEPAAAADGGGAVFTE